MKTLSCHFINNILSYGMIAGLLIIIVRAVVYLSEVDLTNKISIGVLNFVYNLVVLFICIYLGTIAYRKKTVNGNLAYGQGLLSCVAIGFVATFLVFIYDLVFCTIIAPDYLKSILEPQLAAISSNQTLSPMQKIELMYKLEKYKSPFYFTGINALMSFGISVVIALITAIFTVRKRPIVIDNQEEIN